MKLSELIDRSEEVCKFVNIEGGEYVNKIELLISNPNDSELRENIERVVFEIFVKGLGAKVIGEREREQVIT